MAFDESGLARAYQAGEQKRQSHPGFFGSLAHMVGGAISGFVMSGFNPVGLAAGAAASLVGEFAPDALKPYAGVASSVIMKKFGSRGGGGGGGGGFDFGSDAFTGGGDAAFAGAEGGY